MSPARHRCSWLLAILLAAGPLCAQVDRFSDRITVMEVEVPTRVLVRGQPVRGLEVDDFIVLDDGEPAEVVGFSVVDLTESTVADDAAVAPSAHERRSILLLFDFMFSGLRHQVRAVEGARRMVEEQLHPTDRVAVGYLSGSAGFQLVVGFTNDRARTRQAVAVVEAMTERRHDRFEEEWRELRRLTLASAEGEGGDEEKARMISLMQEVGTGGAIAASELGLGQFGSGLPSSSVAPGIGGISVPTSGISRDEVQTDPTASQLVPSGPEALGAQLASGPALSAIRFQTRELERMATWLRDVTGQKHIVFMSQGFGANWLNDHQVSNHLQRMFEGLRRNGWTLHAVDLDGIPGPFDGRGFQAGDLFFMANETGGDLLENFNRIEGATERIIERTSVLYLITIRTEVPSDGKLRPIEVSLASGLPGARVVHRRGYDAPKPAEARSSLERRLDAIDVLLGEIELEEIDARFLAVASGTAGESGLVRVPVVMEVDGQSLVSDDPRVKMNIELHAYALDAGGGVQDLLMQDVRLNRRKVGETLDRGGVRFLGTLDLPPGEYRLRLLVRNGDRMTVGTERIVVSAGGLALHPPLFVGEGDDWLQIREATTGRGEERPEVTLFLATGLNVVPAVEATVEPGGLLPFVLLESRGRPETSVRVVGDDGRDVEGASVRLSASRPSPNGAGRLRDGHVETAGLDPGRYRLEIRDPATGQVAASEFSISG